jgi:hypothetical protein
MPAISSEGEDSCREQTASRHSAVLDDPRRAAVDRRRQSYLPRGKHCHVNSWACIGDSPNLGTCVWTLPAVQLVP